METKNEDEDCCALFLRGINRMCQNFNNKRDGTSCSTYSFNPTEIKSDEHPGNRIAIEKVLVKIFQKTEQAHAVIILTKVWQDIKSISRKKIFKYT